MDKRESTTWSLATWGVVLLAAVTLLPLLCALYRVLMTTFTGPLPEPPVVAAAAGFCIVVAGFVVSAMIALLRLRPRELDDGGPSFAPALAMVVVGAALCAVTVLAGSGS